MNSTAIDLPTEPEINFQDDGKSVFLDISSNGAMAPVSVAWLMEHLTNSRYVHAKIDPIAITYWVKNFNAGYCSKDNVIVAKLIDAQCEIKIDSETMSAYLYITPAMGGAAISRKDIIAAIIASRITSGIINRSITEAIQNPDASKLLIAKGKLPKHGKDSTFEVLISGWTEKFDHDKLDNRLARQTRQEQGLAACAPSEEQYYKPLLLAEPGEKLLVRHLETAGVDGKDIFGNIVSAYQGQQITFTNKMQGVSLSTENPNILVATKHGQICADGNALKILSVANIEHIDTSTGHINYDGTIHVSGNVCPGMQVQASGDIFIEGKVEHGTYFKAAGDIVIKKGAFGKNNSRDKDSVSSTATLNIDNKPKNAEHNEVQLFCRGNIYVLSLHHARVRTEKSLYASNLIAQCDVEVGDKVWVGNKHSEFATIEGGTIKARYLIHANILGSPDAVLTRLQVGDNQATLAQANLLTSEINECSSKRCALEIKLAQCSLLETGDGSAKKNKSATLLYLNNEILELSNLLMLYQIEHEKCLAESQALLQAKIDVNLEINPNLRIKIAGHSQTIRNPHPAGYFSLNHNNIKFIAT